MGEITMGVSWIGVIVGAIAAFLAGWLWYSPMLFGKTWADGHGIEMGTAQTMPVAAMVTQLLGLLLLSWFVGVTAVESKLLTFVLAVLAFCVLNTSGSLFAKKPPAVIRIEVGYWIVAAIVMFVAQAIF
ncbi:DUF1761 domain-containing protein [Oricola sp.]|uniref:DUF1761 domain-containing protein n=1 Tax=Oricola sp. TaxID=1979950 RepID=UPI0025E2A969|nr:DUF1761 domain-containing protein [Oricola sp.]MCI5076244.1 DUF1761 domain-containing protein [Oricola sp.]